MSLMKTSLDSVLYPPSGTFLYYGPLNFIFHDIATGGVLKGIYVKRHIYKKAYMLKGIQGAMNWIGVL